MTWRALPYTGFSPRRSSLDPNNHDERQRRDINAVPIFAERRESKTYPIVNYVILSIIDRFFRSPAPQFGIGLYKSPGVVVSLIVDPEQSTRTEADITAIGSPRISAW